MGKITPAEIDIPADKVPVHMKVEDNVRIISIDIRSLAVVVVADSLHNCILESQGCEVAVADPAAVRDCLCYGECLLRIKPVLPGEFHGVLEKIIRGLQFVIPVDKNKEPGGASCPHAEAVCGLKVSGEFDSA